jgi:hypothetical protein
LVIAGVVVELVVDPRDLITHLLPYLGVWSSVRIIIPVVSGA